MERQTRALANQGGQERLQKEVTFEERLDQ